MRNFMICTLQQTSFRSSNQGDCDGQGMLHVWGRTQMHTGFQWGNLEERDHLEDKGTDRRILKWILKKYEGIVCTGFIWLRKGASEGCFKHGNETSNSMKCKEFLDQLRNY